MQTGCRRTWHRPPASGLVLDIPSDAAMLGWPGPCRSDIDSTAHRPVAPETTGSGSVKDIEFLGDGRFLTMLSGFSAPGKHRWLGLISAEPQSLIDVCS